MASFNGNIGTPSGTFNLKVEYSISQSVSGNYSDVTATCYVKRNTSSANPYNSSSSSSLVINGTSKSYTGSYDLRSDGYKTITSNTVRVPHNNDGTKSITISFSFNGKLSSYYPNGSISQTITLPTIPRTATVTSAIDFNDEGNPTITFNNPGGFQLVPYLNFWLNGSLVKSITRSKGNYTSPYTWQLTETERNEIRQVLSNYNSCSVNEGLDTYNGNTKLGYSSIGKVFTIVNANPTFNNFEFEDTNATTIALTGNNQDIIQGYSNVKAIIPTQYIATANKYATMSKYSFVCSDMQTDIAYSGDSSTNGTINGVKSGVFNVYAIDSRNNSTLVIKNANTTIPYTPLTKGNIAINRSNGTSEETTLQIDGVVDLVDFGQVVNSIQTAKYRYKQTDSDVWSAYSNITLTVDANGNFSFNNLILGDTNVGFDIDHSYNIEVVVEDELSQITYTANLGSGIPNLALHKNGVSIMGKYDTTIGGKAQINGNPLSYYPIGSLYMSINSTSPEDLFGGTWEQVTDDAYLKIVTSNAGDLAGTSSEHKIPVTSLPSHSHSGIYEYYSKKEISNRGDGGGGEHNINISSVSSSQNGSYSYLYTGSAGSGQAYYPYYYGIYVWVRTA